MSPGLIDKLLGRPKKRIPTKHESQIAANYETKPDDNHNDLEVIEVQPGLTIEVFWKVEHPFLGRGPSAVVYIGNKSVLKFDCFGAEQGHLHIYALEKSGKQRLRIFLREQTAEEQVARAEFELFWNLESYLGASRLERARNFVIFEKDLEVAAKKMGDRMRQFLRDVPQLQKLSAARPNGDEIGAEPNYRP